MNAGFSVPGGKPLNTKLSKLALWMPRCVTTWATATERQDVPLDSDLGFSYAPEEVREGMKQRFDTYFPPTPGHASTESSALETVPRRRAWSNKGGVAGALRSFWNSSD